MKKIVLIGFATLFLITGCGKYGKNDAMKDFSKMVDNTKNYNIKGTLEILNNDELFKYDVDVLYKKGDYYKVSLINKTNSHEQIILRNDEGVYVITPSLNKSFKFQSEWPDNSSQAYILKSLLTDLENDRDKKFKNEKNECVFTTKVNYPNNRELVKEKIYLDKKMNLKKVVVYNTDNNEIIKFNVSSFDKKINNKKKDFKLNSNIIEKDTKEETSKETSNIDEIIYPMYLPENTRFESEEKVVTEDTNRVILNFKGDKPFTLIEEEAVSSEEFEIIPVSGELTFMAGTIGSMTNTSINWNVGEKDYYLVGENLNEEDLINIAASTTAVSMNK